MEGGPIEGPWALPKGWRWEKLLQVSNLHDNLRRPVNNTERLDRNAGKLHNELYPYYGATGCVGHIDEFLFEGDYVLLGEDGAPFLDPMKQKAYSVSGRFWVNNHAHILSAKSFYSNRLLLHWLNTIRYEPYVNGTTRLKLTQGAMAEILVPVPRLEIQPLLASTIDGMFSELDDGEALLARARDDLGTWRKALLKAATTGELTADWRTANPSAETGAALLTRILDERRARWLAESRNKGKLYKPPPLPVSDELPTIPHSWTIASLPQLGDFGRGKSKHRPRDDARLYGGPHPFVQTGIVSASRGSITKSNQTYSDFGLAQSKLWPKGTLCITIAANIAKTGVLTFDACFPDSIVGISVQKVYQANT